MDYACNANSYQRTHLYTLVQVTVCCIEVCMRLCSRKKATPTSPKPEKKEKGSINIS